MIIDSQVHAYERDRPERPWIGSLAGPSEVTGDDMIAAMDEVGVDGALLVSPWSMYRYDASYALQVHAEHPQRFGLIKPVDAESPTLAQDIADWASAPGAVGIRIVMMEQRTPPIAALDNVLRLAVAHDLPVNVLAWGRLDVFADLARRHPNNNLVLDHLGITQVFAPPIPEQPFADLDQVIALATYDHVAIKISGAGTLSKEAYPFTDIWPALARLFEAFSFERCMWGSDWTRATAFLTYREAVDAFVERADFSSAEREALMGGTLARIYRWAPGEAKPAA